LLLGKPYTVAGYPTGNNAATGLPWAPAADGLRNIAGRVSGDNAILYAVTSTVSGSGDQGADPNKLLQITDKISNTDPVVGGNEVYVGIRLAQFGEVLRGVTFAPGTN
jgi:hypothetical protein